LHRIERFLDLRAGNGSGASCESSAAPAGRSWAPVVFVVLYAFDYFAVAYHDGPTFIVQNASSQSVWLLALSSVPLLIGLSLGFLIRRAARMRTAAASESGSGGGGGELAAMGCVMTPVAAVVLGLFGYFLPRLLDRVVVTNTSVASVTHRPYFLPPPITNHLEFKDMYDIHEVKLIEWQDPTTGAPGRLEEPADLLRRAKGEIVRRGQQRPNPLSWCADDIYCFFRQDKWASARTYILHGNKLVIVTSQKGGWAEDDRGNLLQRASVKAGSGIAGWAQLGEPLMAKVKAAAVREWTSEPVPADIVTANRIIHVSPKGIERTIIRPSSGERPITTFHSSSERSLQQFLDDLEVEATTGQAFYDWWTKDKKLEKLVRNPRMPR
jgi:hypothetical protein